MTNFKIKNGDKDKKDLPKVILSYPNQSNNGVLIYYILWLSIELLEVISNYFNQLSNSFF